MANAVAFSALAGLSKEDIYKNFGIGLYYRLGVTDYTKYYESRQITRVSGFSLMLTMTL